MPALFTLRSQSSCQSQKDSLQGNQIQERWPFKRQIGRSTLFRSGQPLVHGQQYHRAGHPAGSIKVTLMNTLYPQPLQINEPLMPKQLPC